MMGLGMPLRAATTRICARWHLRQSGERRQDTWTPQGTDGFLGPEYGQGQSGDLPRMGYPSTALIQMGDWCGSALLMTSPCTKTWARHYAHTRWVAGE